MLILDCGALLILIIDFDFALAKSMRSFRFSELHNLSKDVTLSNMFEMGVLLPAPPSIATDEAESPYLLYSVGSKVLLGEPKLLVP